MVGGVVSRKSIESKKIKFKNRFKDFQDLRELTNILVMHELRCACVSRANLGGSKESLTRRARRTRSWHRLRCAWGLTQIWGIFERLTRRVGSTYHGYLTECLY